MLIAGVEADCARGWRSAAINRCGTSYAANNVSLTHVTVQELDRPLCAAGVDQRMGHHDDGGARFWTTPGEQVPSPCSRWRYRDCGGLVGENQFGLETSALAIATRCCLPAGELLRQMARAMGNPDAFRALRATRRFRSMPETPR